MKLFFGRVTFQNTGFFIYDRLFPRRQRLLSPSPLSFLFPLAPSPIQPVEGKRRSGGNTMGAPPPSLSPSLHLQATRAREHWPRGVRDRAKAPGGLVSIERKVAVLQSGPMPNEKFPSTKIEHPFKWHVNSLSPFRARASIASAPTALQPVHAHSKSVKGKERGRGGRGTETAAKKIDTPPRFSFFLPLGRKKKKTRKKKKGEKTGNKINRVAF